MDIDASEKEQIDSLKKWWKENGTSVVSGLLIGLSVLFGSRAWFSFQDRQMESASDAYAQMMDALGKENLEQARSFANIVITQHSGTSYAPLTALALAKIAVDEGTPEVARNQLEWALEHADTDELQHTARIRLIRILLDQENYPEAGTLLTAQTAETDYQYQYLALKGDLAIAQEDTDAARAFYQEALDAMPAQASDRGLIQTKYDQIALPDSGE
ncbi:MAG: tetratricopeptide repeat protein [Gammaproteobacteria bacterium]